MARGTLLDGSCLMALHDILEGRMNGKPTRGRRRLQMLHDLTKGDCYAALKRSAEERKGWR